MVSIYRLFFPGSFGCAQLMPGTTELGVLSYLIDILGPEFSLSALKSFDRFSLGLRFRGKDGDIDPEYLRKVL